MDLKKAKKLLSKINSLFQNIQSDEENLSAIEKDLMLSYLRDLYEQFQSGDTEKAKTKASKAKPEEEVEVIRVEKPSAPPPPPKPRPKPRIVEIPEKVKKSLDLDDEPSNPAPPPDPEPEPAVTPEPAPKVEEKPADPPKPKPVSKDSFSDEIEELFDMPKAKELSDKLGELPIKDLTKAMGLNEKIFTINELFGGNQEAFDRVIQHLNTLSAFDDAKSYLKGVAEEFDWAAKSKGKKARNFIKLVRRRYQ